MFEKTEKTLFLVGFLTNIRHFISGALQRLFYGRGLQGFVADQHSLPLAVGGGNFLYRQASLTWASLIPHIMPSILTVVFTIPELLSFLQAVQPNSCWS